METGPNQLDQIVDQVLADYAAVEPPPGAAQGWITRAGTAPHSGWFRFGAPAWALVAASLLLLLALGWYFARQRTPDTRARLAQHDHSVLVPVQAGSAPPLTKEDQRLIQTMQSDPGALSADKAGPASSPSPAKKPIHP